MSYSKGSIKSGFVWSALDSFGNQIIGLMISLILANMLTPYDYGLLAMLAIFVNISGLFIDSGLAAAVTRKCDRNEKDYATTFYFSLLMSIIFYLILVGCSQYIADFYNHQQLCSIIPILSLSLIINVFGVVPNTKITVSLNFKLYAIANFISLIISGTIGVLLAINDYNVWALVYQQLTAVLVRVVLLNLLVKWYPTEKFDIKSFMELFEFSSKLMLSNLIEVFYNNIYNIVIGKNYNPKELGMYNQANTLSSLPSSTITWVLLKVTYPLFSEAQNDDERFNKMFLFCLKSVLLIVYPLMFGIAIVSAPLINLLLNKSWHGTAEYLSILCIAFSNYPIHTMNINVLKAKGNSGLILKITLIKKVLATIILIITSTISIKAICYGILFLSYMEVFINALASSRITGLSLNRQFKPLLVIFSSTIISSLIALYISRYLVGDWSILAVSLTIALFIYISSIFLFEKNFIEQFRSNLSKGAE